MMNILAIILYIFEGCNDEYIHHKLVVILYIFERYNDEYIYVFDDKCIYDILEQTLSINALYNNNFNCYALEGC